jgi:hypothetical protein
VVFVDLLYDAVDIGWESADLASVVVCELVDCPALLLFADVDGDRLPSDPS